MAKSELKDMINQTVLEYSIYNDLSNIAESLGAYTVYIGQYDVLEEGANIDMIKEYEVVTKEVKKNLGLLSNK